MSASETPAVPAAARGRALNITLWVVQILMAAFFLFASAAPKLVGERSAVEIFTQIGAGQWLRYLVGVLELAGAIGLLIPRLAGLAALGLAALMVGAFLTQVFILESINWITPAILFVVFVLIAWGRWPQTKALAGKLKR
jgi:putative oxidoreductase